LSLAPGLWVVVAFAGMIFGRESARARLDSFVLDMVGPTGAMVVSGVLDQIDKSSSTATVAGLLSMFFGATVLFGALQYSLNTIWEQRRIASGFWRGVVQGYVRGRLLSFVVVLAAGMTLLLSLALGTLISGAARFTPSFLPAPEFVLQAVNFLVSLGLMTALFATVYKVLPDARFEWRDVWIGAAFTALLFTIGKTLIALYLGRAGLSSAYGAAGSLVVFLLWVYYSAQIFLFGAEFTEIYAHRPRHDPTPVVEPPAVEPPAVEPPAAGPENAEPEKAERQTAQRQPG